MFPAEIQFVTGVDKLQAAARVGGVDVFSNSVPVRWHSGTNLAPVVSGGGDISVVFPGSGALNGSVVDDGLPSNNLTAAWTLVSWRGRWRLTMRRRR